MEAALGKLPFRLPAAIQKPWSTGLRRSFLRVWGPDAQKFINGLNSNATMELAEGTGQYTAFLTPQGRMLHDAFVWRTGKDDFVLDAHERVGQDLLCHLKQYKLRSRLEMEPSFGVHCSVQYGHESRTLCLSMVDRRGGLGFIRQISEAKVDDTNSDMYKTLRFAMGIPEGPLEIPQVQAIPLEYNIDWLGGISYHKGCYLGQELVARTHHRGIIRKRLMPVMILMEDSTGFEFDGQADYSDLVNAEVHTGDVVSGKVIATHGNLGFALTRLEHSGASGLLPRYPSLRLQAYAPPWWPTASPVN